MYRRFIAILISTMLLTGCAKEAEISVIPPISTSTQIMNMPSSEHTEQPEITQTIPPIMSPTPDMRLKPESWQDWPIIPEATNRVKEIYQDGLVKGVDQKAFSKIGDCQNVKEAFMIIYDVNQYYLQDWQKDWQEAIDQFHGFFNRDAKAFGQGLNVAAALSPFHSDPEDCLTTEGPLQCELRIANPAFAFIRFERWWTETPPDVYEKYLREIIEITIEHGTVPILMTKADNIEGKHQINKIIAKLAFEYDIPLYNWWRAAQALPNNGLDPVKNDNFHLDPIHAWTEQSAYALGTLYTVWKGAIE